MHVADDLVMCLGDFNGHVVGKHIDGFDGGYGIGQRNLEGRMLCLVKELCVSNTWYKKE